MMGFAKGMAPTQKSVITLDAQGCLKEVGFSTGMAPKEKSVFPNLTSALTKDAATLPIIQAEFCRRQRCQSKEKDLQQFRIKHLRA
jgi:hypothetical protein